MNDHTDTESVDSAVPRAQFPRKETVYAITTSHAINQREPTSTRHIFEFFKFSLDLDWEPEKENPFAMLFNQDFQLHGNDTLPTDIVGVRVLCRQLSTS